jgi:hypothetical protein
MIRMANRRHISHTGHTVTRRRVLTTGLAAGLALAAPGVDQTLRRRPEMLLRGSSPKFPEVHFAR